MSIFVLFSVSLRVRFLRNAPMMYLFLALYTFSLTFIVCYNIFQLNLLRHYIGRKRLDLPPPIDQENLPFVTIQLPLFNEPYVAERLIDNIVAMGSIRYLWHYLTRRILFGRDARCCFAFCSYFSKKESNFELYLAHRSLRMLFA